MVDGSKDFEELFACLARRGVEYVIIGAHAVAFHAKPRYTKDIDLLVGFEAPNATRLVRALEDFGFGSVGLTPTDFTTPGIIVQLGVAPNRVDLITQIPGVSFDEALAGRVAGSYGLQPVWFIGLDALIRAKEASGRPQDLADLAWLRGR